MRNDQIQSRVLLDTDPVFTVPFLEQSHVTFVECEPFVVAFRVFELDSFLSLQIPEGDAHVEVADGLDVGAILGPLGMLEAVDALVNLDLEVGVHGRKHFHQFAFVLLGEHLFRVG